MRILGLSCFYHDAAACVIEDGRIVAAAQEERFTRKKHDQDFPINAIRYCLAEAGAEGGVEAVAFYDKPILKTGTTRNAGQHLVGPVPRAVLLEGPHARLAVGSADRLPIGVETEALGGFDEDTTVSLLHNVELKPGKGGQMARGRERPARWRGPG